MSARHPWRTLLIWIVVVAAIAGLSGTFGGDMDNSSNGGFTSRPESVIAEELIADHFGEDTRASENIVVHSPGLTVDDPGFRQVVDTTLSRLQPWGPDFASITNYYDLAASGAPEANTLVSQDRHSLLIPITFAEEPSAYSTRGADFVEAAQGARTPDVEVYAVGDISAEEAFGAILEEDLSKEVSVGLPMAGIILVVVFGALVAAFLPLAIGVLAIAATTAILGLLAHLMIVDASTMSVVSMIGLAVGIDYALFFFERFREERRHGALKIDAIERAGGTAGKAVLFSGATVILALAGLLLMPINVFQSIGIAVGITVVVAVAAALTLLPAMIRLIGDWASFPRFGMIRKLRRQDRTGIAEFEDKRGKGLWGHVANAVMRRPVISTVVSAAILVAFALPALTMQLGQTSTETLPETDFKSGYMIIARDFGAGLDSPMTLVVDGNAGDPGTRANVERMVTTLEGDGRFGDVTATVSEDGVLTRIDAVTQADPFSGDAEDIINQIRSDVVPEVFGDQADSVYITGETAFSVDFNNVLVDNLPAVLAFVLGLSFLLLMLAFRSIVVPLKAIVLNLLSVGAAYGATVAVFQHGWGADVFGFTQVESIVSWLPVMLFCILFGLSMDYHVFLLSRIREHYDQTHDNEESVAFGLQSTGRIITGAALIMVSVFGAFASGQLADVQQMGFGLGFAVLVDATLIRTILVPASMKLLGNANWYLPRWLHWLPDLRVEGDLAPIVLRRRGEAVREQPDVAFPVRDSGKVAPQAYE
jgi:RND superfamily putative drug exporter